MKVYTVHAPAADADPMKVVFVKEGVAWPALFFPVLWLLFHRMWLALVVYVVVFGALGIAGETLGGPLPPVVIAGLQILFALEANQLRRRSLARRGFDLVGVVRGGSREEAEIRYFADIAAARRPVAPPPIERAAPAAPAATASSATNPATNLAGGQVVGLFPAPAGPGGAAR